jgi:hypothetical protein
MFFGVEVKLLEVELEVVKFEVVEFEVVTGFEGRNTGVDAAGTVVAGVPVVLAGDLALVVLAGDFAREGVFFAGATLSAEMVLAGTARAGDFALEDDLDSCFFPNSYPFTSLNNFFSYRPLLLPIGPGFVPFSFNLSRN